MILLFFNTVKTFQESMYLWLNIPSHCILESEEKGKWRLNSVFCVFVERSDQKLQGVTFLRRTGICRISHIHPTGLLSMQPVATLSRSELSYEAGGSICTLSMYKSSYCQLFCLSPIHCHYRLFLLIRQETVWL